MIILDASILIKWFLQEEDSESALQFKERLLSGEEDIAVPDLALYEITNVLRFKPKVREEAINAVLPSFFNLGLEIITPSEKLLTEAIHLSFITNLSIYDCIYLALANNLGTNLITADKHIVHQAESFVSVNLL